jgi:hypothetical protein
MTKPPDYSAIAARRYAAFVAGAEGVAQPGGAMPAMVLPSNALQQIKHTRRKSWRI